MPIEVTCVSCGKRYRAPDRLAGKRLPCTNCKTTLLVPQAPPPAPPPPAPAAASPEPDFDAFAALGAGDPVELADDARPGGGRSQSATVAPPPSSASSPQPAWAPPGSGRSPGGGRMPAWAAPWVERLGRMRPRSLWAWVVAVVVVLVAVGFAHPTAAYWSSILLLLLGALALVAALVWALVVGFAVGSRVIIGMMVAAPLASLAAQLKLDRANLGDASLPMLMAGLAGGVAIAGLLFGLLTHPRAFRLPLQVGLAAVLLVVLSRVPRQLYLSSTRGNPFAAADQPDGEPVQVKTAWMWRDGVILRREGGWALAWFADNQSMEWVPPWRIRPRGLTGGAENLPMDGQIFPVYNRDDPPPRTPPPPRPAGS
jgi:hypothetical protein